MYPDSETPPRSITKECLDQLRMAAKGTGQSMGAFVPFLLLNVSPWCTGQAILAGMTFREASRLITVPGSEESTFGLSLLPGQGIVSRFWRTNKKVRIIVLWRLKIPMGQKTLFRSLAFEFSLRNDPMGQVQAIIYHSQQKLITHQCHRVLTPERAFMSVAQYRGVLKTIYRV